MTVHITTEMLIGSKFHQRTETALSIVLNPKNRRSLNCRKHPRRTSILVVAAAEAAFTSMTVHHAVEVRTISSKSLTPSNA